MKTKEMQQVMANRKKTIAEIEQELYEIRQRQTINQLKDIPDPKKHHYVSFVKSGVRIVACALGFFGFFEIGFLGLFLAELIGIYEELV